MQLSNFEIEVPTVLYKYFTGYTRSFAIPIGFCINKCRIKQVIAIGTELFRIIFCGIHGRAWIRYRSEESKLTSYAKAE